MRHEAQFGNPDERKYLLLPSNDSEDVTLDTSVNVVIYCT
jgi:hypothetical protein